jgi:acetyl esterase/lipase
MWIKVKVLVSVIFLLSYNLCISQDYIIPLWSGKIPNSKKSNFQEVTKNGRVISKVIVPTIEVYLPSKFNATGKIILICPGGGYGALAYDKEGTDIAKWLNGHGIAGAVLKYRLPEDESNEKPNLSPLMDAKRGIEIIRLHVNEWGIDSNKVGVLGFSAGGHLASTLGTHFELENRPDFMVLVYPVVTMKVDYTHIGSRANLLGEDPEEDIVNYYSNELQVTENTPSTFIIHSVDDKVVPIENSLNLFKALKDKNVPVEMHFYPYGGHGFSMALKEGRLSKWRQLLLDWLKDI